MDEFEKETLKFFEDIVSYGAENHACISVDKTIIEYFKVAIKAINMRGGESMKVFCEECKHLPNCEFAKHEEVDTCKKGESIECSSWNNSRKE